MFQNLTSYSFISTDSTDVSEVNNIRTHAMNFTGGPALFSFPTFSAWACQGKLEDRTRKGGEEGAKEMNRMPKRESEIRVES